MRMKVVHAAKFYPPVPGGMETVVRDLAEGTSDDWEVAVVAAHTAPKSTTEQSGRVMVTRVGSLGTVSSVPLCPGEPLALWRSRANCMVLHEPNPIAATALLCRTPADHLVIWHHSDVLRPWWAPWTYGRIQRALYRRASAVIVSSPNLAAASPLVQQARHVEVVPFGIPVARYQRRDSSRQDEIRRIRERVRGPRVLFVGRFVYYKGLHVLIDAMEECPGTLMLVGDGPLESEIRRHVAARGLGDRVVFVGRVSDEDLPAYYQAADVFVLPSIAPTETFGVAQVEAMAAGTPVVSTNLPTGVPWVNQHGVTGLVVPPGDAPALARALGQLLADHNLRDRLGRDAMRRAEVEFDRPRMIAGFRRVVESVVASAPGGGRVRAQATAS